MEADAIAKEAAVYGTVTGVLAAESASGRRSWLIAFSDGWLVVDAAGRPVEERAAVREVASLVAMAEVAAELAGEEDEARVASPAYLDRVGTDGLQRATAVVEAFVDDVLLGYKRPLR